MHKSNFTFSSFQDNLTIHATMFLPNGDAKGIVQVVHGMSEHRQRYYPFLKFLANEGYIALINDHRGHGDSVKSKDDLGCFYETSGTYIVEDTHQLTYYMKKKYPTLPYYLFGHSMGSLVVRAYMKKYDYDVTKVILCGSPSKNPMALAGQTLVILMRLLKGEQYRSQLIQNISFKKFQKQFVKETSKNAWLCSDPKVVKAYDKDVRCGFIFTLNGFENLFRLMRKVYNDDAWLMANKDVPIFFIAGSEDPCIVSKSRFRHAYTFMEKVGYTNVVAKLYPSMRHEILNETNKTIVYADILNFLETTDEKKCNSSL